MIPFFLAACGNSEDSTPKNEINTEQKSSFVHAFQTTKIENSLLSNDYPDFNQKAILKDGKIFIQQPEEDKEVQLLSSDVINENNNEYSPNAINIQLTGQMVKYPISQISSFNNVFETKQYCTSSNENYMLIDSALIPYLSDDTKDGIVHLKDGEYKFSNKVTVELYTKPLTELFYEGTGNISLTCINNTNFTLNNVGLGSVDFSNINPNLITIYHFGTGDIFVNGKHLNSIYATNKSNGNIKIKIPVDYAELKNFSNGSIKLNETQSLDAFNYGSGNITVLNSTKTNQQVNKSSGNIKIN